MWPVELPGTLVDSSGICTLLNVGHNISAQPYPLPEASAVPIASVAATYLTGLRLSLATSSHFMRLWSFAVFDLQCVLESLPISFCECQQDVPVTFCQ